MKKNGSRMVGCAVFLLCGVLIFLQTAEILRRKTAAESDMVHSFYELEENSLDVLFLGSSHLYYGIQPNVLWREYGITSYIMGSPEQTAATSYFLLKEALQYQKPTAVVFESYYLWNKSLYNGEARLRQAFDGMRMGRTKLEMIRTMLPEHGPKTKLTYCLPFLKYHGRWNALEDYDFHPSPYLKGARIDYTVEKLENPEIPEEMAELPENSRIYLEKIRELCEENGIQLVVMAIPYGIETGQERYDRRQGMNLWLENELQEQDIPFLFYQKQEPDLIDFSVDFRDRTHLNTAGAEKLTGRLGAWLAETYSLTGHKEDPAFASWDEDLGQYEREAAAQRENPVNTADDAE